MTPQADIDGHLPLHHLELRILLALMPGPTYGTLIVEGIEASERSGMKLYPANLYRRIRDLMSKGLIEETDAPVGADTRRTYVRLTSLGRKVLQADAHRLQGLIAEAARHRLIPES